MPTPLPGSIPADITTVEQLVVYALDMYNRVAAGRHYSERSDSDRRPFCQVSVDNTFGVENNSQRFMISRLAVPLNPNYDLEGKTQWEDTYGLSGSVTLPPGFID